MAGFARAMQTCSIMRPFILVSLFQAASLVVWKILSMGMVNLAEAEL